MGVSGARPLYETEEDRGREGSFIEAICTAWQCEARKLPIHYKLDFALLRDGIVRAFLETKVRNYARNYFDMYMISMAKVLSAREYSAFTNVPSLLAVRWNDGDGFIDLHSMKDFEIGFGGRADRGDSQDMEPVVFIPIENFGRLITRGGR
jgi:hypothetical protein